MSDLMDDNLKIGSFLKFVGIFRLLVIFVTRIDQNDPFFNRKDYTTKYIKQ